LGLYTCDFCTDRLRPDYPHWYQYPLLVILVRPYYCPHCGDRALRPITSLRKLFGAPEVRDLPAKTSSRKRRSKHRKESTGGSGLPEQTVQLPVERPPDTSLSSETGTSERVQAPETESPSPAEPTSRTRSKQSRKSRRSSRRRSKSAKEHYVEIAAATGQTRVSSYGGRGFFSRVLRKLKRRLRKMLGLKTKSKRSSSSRKSDNSRRKY
jgi:hypothetical protein